MKYFFSVICCLSSLFAYEKSGGKNPYIYDDGFDLVDTRFYLIHNRSIIIHNGNIKSSLSFGEDGTEEGLVLYGDLFETMLGDLLYKTDLSIEDQAYCFDKISSFIEEKSINDRLVVNFDEVVRHSFEDAAIAVDSHVIRYPRHVRYSMLIHLSDYDN